MDVTPLIKSDQQVIQSYKSGSFRVSNALYDHPIFVFPDRTVQWVTETKPSDMTLDDFKALVEHSSELDLILLGCGAGMDFVSASLRKDLKTYGLNIETMDTGAACRTYNVLMAEGRRLVAALLPA